MTMERSGDCAARTHAAHPQPPARRAHRRGRLLQRRTRPPRRPARPGARSRPALRQDLRDALAARPAAARHHARADRRGLHPPARPAAVRAGPRPGRLRARSTRGWSSPRRPPEAVDIVSGLWRKDTGSQAELRKIAFTPAGLVVPSRDWLIGRRRRTGGAAAGRRPAPRRAAPARRAGGATGAGARARRRPRPGAAGRAAARSGRRAAAGRARRHRRARPGPARYGPGAGPAVTAGDVEALRSVGELFRALDHAYGGGHARQALVRYLEHEAEPMLRGAYGEPTGPPAVRRRRRPDPAGRLDLVRHRRRTGSPSATSCRRCGSPQAAGDRAYGGYVLVTMSRQAVYLGHGREAVQLARVAQQGVGARGAARRAGAAARRGGARATACSARCGPARRRWPARSGRWRPRGPGEDMPPLGALLRRGAARRRVRALPPRPPAVPGGGAARGALAAAARRRRTPAAGCSAGWCWRRRGWGWARWSRRARWARRRRSRRREMRSVRAHEYVRDFERRLEPYRDAAPVRGYRERVAALA